MYLLIHNFSPFKPLYKYNKFKIVTELCSLLHIKPSVVTRQRLKVDNWKRLNIDLSYATWLGFQFKSKIRSKDLVCESCENFARSTPESIFGARGKRVDTTVFWALEWKQ